jgi:hypothetical protein
MRYWALAIAVVLAAGPSCPGEVAQLTATLTPTTIDVTMEATFFDPTFGSPVTNSDTITSGMTGVQSIRLDCTFDSTSHAVSSVNNIVFLLSYGDKIEFTEEAGLHMSYITPYTGTVFCTVDLVNSVTMGGGLSTGRQDREMTPPITPDPSPVTGGTFPLDRSPGPGGNNGGQQGVGDVLFVLNKGQYDIHLNYGPGIIEDAHWWFDPDAITDPPGEGSEEWNDNDMPGNGTVSASLAGIAGGVATYDVDVSVPVDARMVLGGISGISPDPLGFVRFTTTLEFSGQFTREVHMPMAGDADDDGDVDATDASILGKNWLQSGTGIGWAQGDFNGDKAVNDKDAAILAAHWGQTAEGANVPEPSVLVLMFSGIGIALSWWWRRSA